VDKKVFKDASNHTVEHTHALKRVMNKLFVHLGEQMAERKITEAMKQFHLFRNKLCPFNAETWWNHEYAKNGESHLWHKHHTLDYCKELAYVACRVCSKLLGIGSCERVWGNTKIQNDGQHTSMSSSNLEKTATLYGANCLASARARAPDNLSLDCLDYFDHVYEEQYNRFMECSYKDGKYKCDDNINDDDSDDSDDADSICGNTKLTQVDLFNSTTKCVKYFCPYLEKWEEKNCYNNSTASHYRLLSKYGGMQYIWPKTTSTGKKHACYITDSQLVWKDKVGNEKDYGWCVILVPKGVEFVDANYNNYEHEPIKNNCNNLHLLIAISTQQENIIMLDENNSIIKPKSFHEKHFPNIDYVGAWERFPNYRHDNLFISDDDSKADENSLLD